ncbi:hypothetical protein FIBSPDRAFT_954324 [Athelia psychrophila]|uniref:Transmembrane protein n=1 Tax=Athelia psychrophila TaxID=1759441 RepID=A0A166J913_9AGAM|nr:hypothetical protein FIBSPDRAFT_954324 [Fibularhizoctonia sp. CBS 109695]
MHLLSSTIYLLVIALSGVAARAVDANVTSLPTSNISSSILSTSSNGTASSQRCTDLDTCRTKNQIVVSCLATILACVWFAVHRNIPAPAPKPSQDPRVIVRAAKRAWSVVLGQREAAIVFVVALIAPEWILAWAVRQAIVAWKLVGELEEASKAAVKEQEKRCSNILDLEKDEGYIVTSTDGHSNIDGSAGAHTDSEESGLMKRRYNPSTSYSNCDKCEGRGNVCDRVASERRVAKGNECWELSHGFLIVMGGFLFYNTNEPLYPLSPKAVVQLVRRGHLVPPTADEISDKSKGDALSKGVAMAQTLWFVVQCITRRAEHLPVTSLEVMTLAYTVMTVAMYIVWWAKPLNVSCAVRVPEEEIEREESDEYDSIWERILVYVVGGQDRYVDLRQCTRVPTFWAGNVGGASLIADVIALLVAMVFGAVHCIAWYSDFQSPLETQLWRSSAIAITAFPVVLSVAWTPAFLISLAFKSDAPSGFLLYVMYTLLCIVYVAARLILITLSFTSLRALPFGAYRTVHLPTLGYLICVFLTKSVSSSRAHRVCQAERLVDRKHQAHLFYFRVRAVFSQSRTIQALSFLLLLVIAVSPASYFYNTTMQCKPLHINQLLRYFVPTLPLPNGAVFLSDTLVWVFMSKHVYGHTTFASRETAF